MKRFISLLIAAMLVCCVSASWANELVFETGVEHYNDGVKAQKKGDLEAAFSEYQKAYILFGPQESTYSKFILNNTAVMYAQQGNFANAEELFLQVLSIDPRNLKACQDDLFLCFFTVFRNDLRHRCLPSVLRNHKPSVVIVTLWLVL